MSTTFQINRKVRDAVIVNLRRIFTADPIYPYVELGSGEYDFDKTKIIISDAIPDEHAFFPAIIVDTVSGTETRYLGPDDLAETKDSNFQVTEDRLFASIDLTVNINVYTIDDTIARDEIVDRIYDQFKLVRDDLAEAGIEIKRVNFSPERRVYQDNRWYITAQFSLEVYTEWVDDLGVKDLVEKIPITLTLSP